MIASNSITVLSQSTKIPTLRSHKIHHIKHRRTILQTSILQWLWVLLSILSVNMVNTSFCTKAYLSNMFLSHGKQFQVEQKITEDQIFIKCNKLNYTVASAKLVEKNVKVTIQDWSWISCTKTIGSIENQRLGHSILKMSKRARDSIVHHIFINHIKHNTLMDPQYIIVKFQVRKQFKSKMFDIIHNLNRS